MAVAENKMERPDDGAAEKPKSKVPLYVIIGFAVILSLGSMLWATFSLLDYFQVGQLDPMDLKWSDVNPIGLSAASTLDIAWSITVIAEYMGVRILVKKPWGEKGKKFDILPWVGWAEVLFLTTLLYHHGKGMGEGAAAFAAILPLLARFSWEVVFRAMKNPSDLTEAQEAQLAEERRNARMAKQKSLATAELHEAELEAQRRENEAKLENARAEIERLKMEEQAKRELEEARLRGEHEAKLLAQKLDVELKVAEVRGRNEIHLMRLDAEDEMALRAPIRPRLIQGQVLRQAHPALESAEASSDPFAMAMQGFTEAQVKAAQLALSYYEVNAAHGGSVTKSSFCEVNKVNPPRLSEATKQFPVEWFQQQGLATWVKV